MTGGLGVRDYTLLLPPGWARIPLDEKAPARVKALVAERLSAAPAEHREALRTGLTHDITRALASAGRNGGLDVLLSIDPVAGQPVPASAVVTHLEGQGDGDTLDSLLSTMASGTPGTEILELGVVEAADAPAVRRVSTRTERIEAAGDLPGGALHVTQVDYFVPLPGSDGVLVLTFSTPIAQLGPPLVRLFDVMATSLRWVAP